MISCFSFKYLYKLLQSTAEANCFITLYESKKTRAWCNSKSIFRSNCFFDIRFSDELPAKIASVRWSLSSELKLMILQMQKFSVADESAVAETIISFFGE